MKDLKVSTYAITYMLPLYEQALHDRLVEGSKQYGDASFSCPARELIDQISEELLDVSGWAFILWCQLHDLTNKLKKEEDHDKH